MEISIKNIGETKLKKKILRYNKDWKKENNLIFISRHTFQGYRARSTKRTCASFSRRSETYWPSGSLLASSISRESRGKVRVTWSKRWKYKNKKQKLYIATCIYKKDVWWKKKTEIHVFHTSIFECLVFMCL